MTTQSAARQNSHGMPAVHREAEADLVQRARSGDREAFGQLYEASLDRVYRYIYFRVTDDETAEDLTSKVFLRAWESIPRFKASGSPFIAWLYTIAHNAVIDYYRTRWQTAALDQIESLPSADPLPDEQYDTRFTARSLRECLQQLTAPQRDVVTMRLIDGMNTAEIAARLNKTSGEIRAIQMRGLQALAKILQTQGRTER
jgi:RNA polymerase sigma-70 factor (ECF subfamily)